MCGKNSLKQFKNVEECMDFTADGRIMGRFARNKNSLQMAAPVLLLC
jgi:hypothetical protein